MHYRKPFTFRKSNFLSGITKITVLCQFFSSAAHRTQSSVKAPGKALLTAIFAHNLTVFSARFFPQRLHYGLKTGYVTIITVFNTERTPMSEILTAGEQNLILLESLLPADEKFYLWCFTAELKCIGTSCPEDETDTLLYFFEQQLLL